MTYIGVDALGLSMQFPVSSMVVKASRKSNMSLFTSASPSPIALGTCNSVDQIQDFEMPTSRGASAFASPLPRFGSLSPSHLAFSGPWMVNQGLILRRSAAVLQENLGSSNNSDLQLQLQSSRHRPVLAARNENHQNCSIYAEKNGAKHNQHSIGFLVPASIKGQQKVPVSVMAEEEAEEQLSLSKRRNENSGLSISSIKQRPNSPHKKRRPLRLEIPQTPTLATPSLHTMALNEDALKEINIEGSHYCVAGRKGRRDVMEDTYCATTEIHGDSKQAFFGVFDGHGGRRAADFAAENLGENILDAVFKLEESDGHMEKAVRAGYLKTDEAFLNQNVSSGTCCVTAMIRDGYMVVANAGDCRAVLCRDGVAEVLTCDHTANREDERERIEDLGGYVDYHNGVWRVQGVLAVTRGIGDLHMKELVTAEPDTQKLQITSDCEFLIMASDGLWDKVNTQEAVDLARPFCVEKKKSGSMHEGSNSMAACRKLVELALSRGTKDNVTVIIVDLRHFGK